ncbi:hypothetical protein TgHK011_003735 [Trichoderma gracile]|nr:hypothetical protein TgHK011_003735 [Trichoderma gracile]
MSLTRRQGGNVFSLPPYNMLRTESAYTLILWTICLEMEGWGTSPCLTGYWNSVETASINQQQLIHSLRPAGVHIRNTKFIDGFSRTSKMGTGSFKARETVIERIHDERQSGQLLSRDDIPETPTA